MVRRGGSARRGLATVCFTDMVGSTELATHLGDRRWREVLATFHRTARQMVRAGSGRIVDTAGDGFLALFDSPAAAVECAGAVTDRLHTLGIEVRTGLHTGEVEHLGDKVGGIGVHLGARVAGEARPGEVLITGTVRDLVAGSDLEFLDRGTHELKGVRGEWRLFAVDRPNALPLDPSGLERFVVPLSRRRRRPALISLGGLPVVAAAIVVALLLSHRGPASSAPVVTSGRSVAHIDAGTSTFTLDVPLGHDPTQVTVDQNTVWVLSDKDQTLTGIDGTTGAVLVDKGLGGAPQGLGVTQGAQPRVWITTPYGFTSGGRGGSLLAFDPVTHSTDTPIEVGDGVAALAADAQGVWVTNTVQNTVTRIDPADHGASPPIAVGDNPESIAIGFGSVWVGNSVSGTVTRVDASTGRVSATLSLPSKPTAIAVGSGAVWVVCRQGALLTKIDPATNGSVQTIQLGAPPDDVAVTSTSVWVSEGAAGQIEHIDVRTFARMAPLVVTGHPYGIAASGDDVWVAIGSS